MKKYVSSLAFYFICHFSGIGQSGCTDILATNYNSSAVINNGSCTYPTTTLPSALKVTTPGVSENSGIEWINGNIYTFGDSGNPNEVYKIDTLTGGILQTLVVTNSTNTDWEDITADSNYMYIGDFGNNNGNRTNLKILKISKSQFIGNASTSINVTAQFINFSYSDQTSYSSNSNTNFNCESLITIGDTLYIFTKDNGDLKTRVYRLPKTPGTYTVSPYTNYNVNGLLTGADYNPITNEIVLIGYKSGHLNSFIWHLYDFQGTNFFSGNKRRFELGNTTNAWQTEGINFYNETSRNRLFISCETDNVGAGIYTMDIGSFTASENKIKKENDAIISRLPDNSISLFLKSGIHKIEVLNILGQVENTFETMNVSANEVIIKNMNADNSSFIILKIQTSNGELLFKKIVY